MEKIPADEARRLLSDAPYGVVVLDADLGVRFTNQAARDLIGVSADEVPARASDLIAPHDLDRVLRFRDRRLHGHPAPGRYRLELRRPDGVAVAAEVVVGVTEWDGAPVFQMSVIDVTPDAEPDASERAHDLALAHERNAVLELAHFPADEADLEQSLQFGAMLSARTLGCSRVNIWLFDDTRSSIRCVEEYDAVERTHSSGQALAREAFPEYFAALDRELTVDAHDARHDPRTRQLSADYLVPNGVTSLLDAPIRSAGRLLGVVCHEHTGPARSWMHHEMNFASAVANWIALVLELEERRAAEAEVRQSAARYRSLFDAAPTALWEEDWSGVRTLVDSWRSAGVSDLDAFLRRQPDRLVEAASAIQVVGVNEAAIELYGAVDTAHLIQSVHARLLRAPFPGFRERLVALAQGHRRAAIEGQDERLDGTIFDVRIVVSIPDEHRGSWKRVYAAVEDTSEARALARRLRFTEEHDDVTGFGNVRRLERVVARSRLQARTPAHDPHLLSVEVEPFGLVREHYGAEAAERFLKQVARSMLGVERLSPDALFRFDAAHFGATVDADRDALASLAAELHERIEGTTFDWGEVTIDLAATIGVVPIDGRAVHVHAVLSAAKAARDAARESGPGRTHVYDPASADMRRRHGDLQDVLEVEAALQDGRLVLYRQPIVPSSGRVGDARPHQEILLRLRREDGTLRLPGEFLPAVERHGMAERIDRWVITTTLAWVAAHPAEIEELGGVAVNVSGLSVGRLGFVDEIVAEIGHSRVDPGRLCFEITETAAIANLEIAAHFVHRLRSIGCTVALDDFGSGLSSFGYLRSLAVDFLKIDGLFVRGIADDDVDHAMVRSINDVGHTLGLETIAEFVESDAIRDRLEAMGVDYLQGYAIGRPVPLDG